MKVDITQFEKTHFLRHIIGSAIATNQAIAKGMKPGEIEVEIKVNGVEVDPLALSSVLARSLSGMVSAHDTFTFLFVGKGPYKGAEGQAKTQKEAIAKVVKAHVPAWSSRARKKMQVVSRAMFDIAGVLEGLTSAAAVVAEKQDTDKRFPAIARNMKSVSRYSSYIRDHRAHFTELLNDGGN